MQQALLAKVEPVVSVVGTGTADVVPDTLRLTVSTEAIQHSAAEAQAKSAEAMSEVFQTLTDAGVDAKHIATLYYRLGPHYEQEEIPLAGRGKRKGFKATNTIVVTVHNPGETGRIMDLVVEAGATSLEMNYDYSVPEEARALARERAVADAKAKACHLAQLAGVELGEPLQIREVEHPWAIRAVTLAPAGPPSLTTPPPVRPSQLRIEITAEITYHIKRD